MLSGRTRALVAGDSASDVDELDGAISAGGSGFILRRGPAAEAACDDAGDRGGVRESTGGGLSPGRRRPAAQHWRIHFAQGHRAQSHRSGRSGGDGQEAVAATVGSTKGERSRLDAEAAEGIGTACTRADERMAAALGLAQSAATRFEPAADVSLGGVLAGLPALCANGLLSGIDRHLKLPAGFYSCLHILLTLGFMALSRIRRPEGLRHVRAGEFGKVLGLDRVPEVRTLRAKITLMARTGDPQAWMRELAKTWMESDPIEAGYLYIDGHVRVYHGDQAVLPRRYVSRERLCLRGTTDYWINDALGRPFFVVSKAVTAGLADTLLTDIVPQLLLSVPDQPTAEELASPIPV